jgi:AcrR family transcriptional regulator
MSTEEKLLNSAIALMAKKGYHTTTVADIVKNAGVAQGTFYLYFDSKKALFLKLMDSFYSMLEQAIYSVDLGSAQINTTGELAGKIRDAIRSVLIVYQENRILARIFLREAIGLEPEFSESWESIAEHLANIGKVIIDQAIELNLLPPQNSQIVAHCVVGMVERAAYFWLFEENDYTLEEVVESVYRFELFGISGLPS